MKILHTSDWHLGRTLYGKKRAGEAEAFLEWLLSALDEHDVDALVVAGDVFDTATPAPLYQQLYYRFLSRAAVSQIRNKRRHVVVVGGNHDSPSFLDAPKDLLRFLGVHVVGAARERPEDELLTLTDADGKPELLVCAVPYLRDRDARSPEQGAAAESIQDKDRKLLEGIVRHYKEAGRAAEAGKSLGVPVVGTGHLFAAGGETAEGDGVRDLYIGSLLRVGADAFPACFDYVALGHLHSAQKAGAPHIRYSGSPFPMSAREAAKGGKCVLLAEFENGNNKKPRVTELPVPEFQKIACVSGDMETIGRELGELRLKNDSVWAEVVLEADKTNPKQKIHDLRDKVMELVAGSKVEVLRIRDASSETGTGSGGILGTLGMSDIVDMGELDVSDVFRRCMEQRGVPEDDRPRLADTYRQLLASVYE